MPGRPRKEAINVPNHVTNYLRATQDVIHGLLTEEGVDFNRVIPSPPDDDPIFTATQSEHRDPETGEVTVAGWSFDGYSPLDWNREHWGTKWNGYSDEVLEDDTVLRFDTAWAHPYQVLIELSKRFPDELIQVMYADEDLGSNFGVYVIGGGVITDLPIPDEGSDEGREMASLIKYGEHYDDLYSEEEHTHFSVNDVMFHALHGPVKGAGPGGS